MSARRKVKYREEYTEQFPSIKRGRTEYEAFCKICGSYISIINGGRRDINDHVQSKKHETAVGSSSSKQLTSFFKTQTDGNKVAAAEAAFAFHCVKHHHSYNSNSCTSKILSHVFSDSKVAVNFSSGKTKTEASVNKVISPFIEDRTRNSLSKANYVSITTDTSNHKYLKIFPVLVQYFDYDEAYGHEDSLFLLFPSIGYGDHKFCPGFGFRDYGKPKCGDNFRAKQAYQSIFLEAEDFSLL
ncbi:uncharacterized protein LOC124722278 [Schistocerca piceifrons]|uniref:uncharacterized protein LOC124722278 n=1 Tax=Schistocerca piceifrons TaxID=274613 RepID=UPI001F5F73F4|nr:uncharacterized protein LOC124722278 [Schistocerca piceifrons]